ncbi:MAG: mechanosensitive ion channel family protein [Pseudobdellovibrionaceae bacterium]|jgi:small-conductance mechanosensitive channel
MYDRFIQTKNLYPLIDFEPFVLIALTLLINWLFYRFFLQNVSEERHRNLRQHFQFLIRQFVVLTVLFGGFVFIKGISDQPGHGIPQLTLLLPYLGVLSLTWGILLFVRSSRLAVLQYLFLQSMKAGVPLLLVNIFSLVLTVVLFFWAIYTVFGVQLTPLLATSAAVSIILGLALQDTLGNLIAGISMQLDQSFEIGDWLEIQMGMQKIIGQVKEISWRSTSLVGLSDEKIILPNRFVSGAQISNFSSDDIPMVRSLFFRFEFTADIELAKKTLERAAQEISDIRGIPAPLAYVNEVTESWISVKILYFIDDYGAQFLIGDKVYRKAIDALSTNGIRLAHSQLDVRHIGTDSKNTQENHPSSQ